MVSMPGLTNCVLLGGVCAMPLTLEPVLTTSSVCADQYYQTARHR